MAEEKNVRFYDIARCSIASNVMPSYFEGSEKGPLNSSNAFDR